MSFQEQTYDGEKLFPRIESAEARVAKIHDWNKFFARFEHLEDYKHLKELHKSVCQQIDDLNKEIPKFTAPTNPREDATQQHDKTKLAMLTKQKTRLEKQLSVMEEQIKMEMEVSTNEL